MTSMYELDIYMLKMYVHTKNELTIIFKKINAILLNIKINRPKLESMCGYKLTTNWKNFMEIYLA